MNKPRAVVSLLVLGLAVFAAGRYSGTSSHAQHTDPKRVLYYLDPMHPAYRSDKPGIAPDCGMALEPVYEGEDPAAKLQLPVGAVSISREKQQLIGVRVQTVDKHSGSRLIRTTGHVEADDNRVYRIMAGTEGSVQSLENNPAGTIVKRNQLLATFYSKEFRQAEQSYLISLNGLERAKGSGHDGDEQVRLAETNVRVSEEQLRALGMGDPQIKELAKARQITRDINVISPIDGIVLTRNISPAQRFDRGAEFYRIADLRKIWIIADLFGDGARVLRPGTKVKVTVRELSKSVYATVSDNPPLFDPASRTLKLRLEADNPDMALRPDMFVDLEFRTLAPPGLSVSAEAILDSGLQKIVYVQTSEDIFEPRPVEIGTAFGNRVTVARGLAVGDRVVTAANFLIDSESRMRTGALRAASAKHDTPMTHDPAGNSLLNHNIHPR